MLVKDVTQGKKVVYLNMLVLFFATESTEL